MQMRTFGGSVQKPSTLLRGTEAWQSWERKNLNLKDGKLPRGVGWDTPLKDYALGCFLPLLEYRISKAKKEESQFKLLDIGIGSGEQWEQFYREHGKNIDFNATSLLNDYVIDLFRPVTRLCRASMLMYGFNEPKFHESFDFMVSNMSVHPDECSCLVSISNMLKVGGEAMLHVVYSYQLDSQIQQLLPLLGLKRLHCHKKGVYYILKIKPFDESYPDILNSLEPFPPVFERVPFIYSV